MLPGLSHTYRSFHLASPPTFSRRSGIGRGQQRPATGRFPAALGTSVCSPWCCWLPEERLELAWARVLVSPPVGLCTQPYRCLGTLHFHPVYTAARLMGTRLRGSCPPPGVWTRLCRLRSHQRALYNMLQPNK